MLVTVDPTSAIPPFEQLKQQLIAQITSHALPAGTRLPPVRRLAADIDLAANTVARAYRELEAEGYVITRGRAGTVVSDIAAIDADAQRRAATSAATFVAELRTLGLGDDAILGAVRQAL